MKIRIGAIAALVLFANAAAAQVPGARHVEFSAYPAFANASEIARRMGSPLTTLDLQRRAVRSGMTVIEQPLKLAQEDFVVYVPARRPPHGFSLLVFVPPWQDARLPAGWAPALERYGVIFVSAARSGNSEGVSDRREPLALLAAFNAMHQFPIDADSVYVAGFSGGARVALRLALAYPDLFRGALLNAGSDAIGDAQIPLPPKDLFERFQQRSRLVYVTGEADTSQLGMDQSSIRSLRRWCVFDVQSHVEPSAGHQVMGSTAFAWALSTLLHGDPTTSTKLPACRTAIEQDLDGQLDTAEQLLSRGEHQDAGKLLSKIDARFGGLAAPRIIELANRLATPN